MPSSLYQTGTIAVTNGSKTVTGTGTLWQVTDIRPGDILRINGHSLLYFIEERVSPTELLLDTPFTGVTGAGLSYTIVRMSGDWGASRVLALQVAEYIRNFNADTLTQEALDAALADIDAAMIALDAKVAAAEAAKTNAETAETNAETAATNAAQSLADILLQVADVEEFLSLAQAAAEAAEAGWDAFDDKYLGAKATNPTLDNDGNALQDGAIYFNTTEKEWRAYDLATTSWYANNSGGAIVDRYYQSYAGSGLTYTLPIEPSTENALDVIVGGVPQPKGGSAYTWLGTTLTLSQDPGDDLVEVIIFDALPLGVVPNDSVGVNQLKLSEAADIRAALGINAGLFREKITANRTYYVRTDGSDAHDGLTDTVGGAFLTPQKALDVIATLDLAGFDATISIGAGTFNDLAINKPIVGGSLFITGAGATTIMSASALSAAVLVNSAQAALITISSLKFATAGGSRAGVRVDAAAKVILGTGIEFGACSNSHMLVAAPGGFIHAQQAYTISGGATSHMNAQFQGFIRNDNTVVTLTGTPAFSTAFAYVANGGGMLTGSASFTGAATGKRFECWTGGFINAQNLGVLNFPGSLPGTVASGGIYDGTLIGGVRETLTANRTYYVRTDGSDANDGLSNTAGGAFLTIQKAVNVAAALDMSGLTVTIQVGDGTYTTGFSLSRPVNGTLIVQGNLATPANCHINVAGSANCIVSQNGAILAVGGFKVSSASGLGLVAVGYGTLSLSGAMEFGACGGSHVYCTTNATIYLLQNYTISGGAPNHFSIDTYGQVNSYSRTITLVGTPVFSNRFINVANFGMAYVFGNTYSGAATGTRYQVTSNGIINTGGGGASYLPGSVAAPAPTTQGQYI